MTPAERSVLEDRLRETGMPEAQLRRLMAADELYYRAREVADYYGVPFRPVRGPESVQLAVLELVALIERLDSDSFEPTAADYKRWAQEKLQHTNQHTCVCGALDTDWNEHAAPHGNHAFVSIAENLNRPPQQQE